MPISSRHTALSGPHTLAASLLLLAACSSAGDRRADSAATPAAAAGATGQASTAHDGHAAPGMAAMTGNADHDFLRMMTDHHKGLIEMAHMTKERSGLATAAKDAARLDAKQDAEMDRMMTMLEKEYRDTYAPKVLPQHQAMIDVLKPLTGRSYERTFYQQVVRHHQEAVKMIDDYLPSAKNDSLKAMAKMMRDEQAKEMREFEQKVARAGT